MRFRSFAAFVGSLHLAACAVGVAEQPTDDGGERDSGLLSYDSGSGADARGNADASAHDATAQDVFATLDTGIVDAGIDSPITIDSSTCAATGTLATYDLSGQPGDESSAPVTSTMSGVSAGDLSRASTLTVITGSNSINASGWSTGSLDTTRYFTFSLAPPSTCAMDITSISIDTKVSGTGPANAAIATSDDGFGSMTSFTDNAVSSVSMSVSGATSKIEIRVYGYDASSTAGTLRIQNTLTISGSLK